MNERLPDPNDEPVIDTTNLFMVGSSWGNRGRRIWIQSSRATQGLTPDEALNLAAYLVAMVGDASRFNQILHAVEST